MNLIDDPKAKIKWLFNDIKVRNHENPVSATENYDHARYGRFYMKSKSIRKDKIFNGQIKLSDKPRNN